jgi:prevent-host-death family protein
MINTVSITDLKQNTSKVIGKVKEGGKSLVILQRSKAAAVLVDPDYFDVLEQSLEDVADLKAIEERKDEKTVDFEKYFAKRFGKSTKK